MSEQDSKLKRPGNLSIDVFTINEICDAWLYSYGEDMKEEYPAFIRNLKRRPSPFKTESFLKTDIIISWYLAYGEDMVHEYNHFWQSLNK